MNMAFWHVRFRDLPIRTKVMLFTCAASLLALFALATGLYFFELRNFRNNFEREIRTLARIMAENCAPALAFKDAKTACEVMSPLKVKPEIHNAAVLGKDGAPFAYFGAEDRCPVPQPEAPAGLVDYGAWWTVIEPIVLDGQRIGTFYVDVDYGRSRDELQRLYRNVTAAVLGGAVALVLLLTAGLQAVITRPIRRLAQASEAVAQNHDYTVRVSSPGTDELGQLTVAFNQMLERIQEQDAALQAARSDLEQQVSILEKEVTQRTTAQAAQARLTAILEATPDFVSSADPSGRVRYLNRGARKMVGLTEDVDCTEMRIPQFHPEWAARLVLTEGLPRAIAEGVWVGETALVGGDGREIHVSQVIIAHLDAKGEVEYISTVIRDVSERKAAEERLAVLNAQLVETSRQAGMAEVATGVLHNVGNVLNSVNIAASSVIERLRASKIDGVAKASALLEAHAGDLPGFLTEDAQGRRLPGYLQKLAGYLAEENAAICGELEQLGRNVEHIKEIVAMQQSHARVSSVFEEVRADHLVEEALRLLAAGFARLGIDLVRDLRPVPMVRVDPHKALQILINLVRNAKYSVEEAARPDPQIVISVDAAAGPVRIAISDNGVGIAPENLVRIFRHGFTTRKGGHGFGLHSAAIAAKEMGGVLSVASPGLGLGATFTLELPAVVSTVP